MWPAAEIDPDDPTELPANLVEVGGFPSSAEAADRGLVILAMGLPFWLLPSGSGFALLVEREQAGDVRTQLEKYELESAHWPPPPVTPGLPRQPGSGITLTLWALALLCGFWAQQRRPGWTEFGSLQSAGIFTRGEWWRPITALFLHGDVGHLFSNAVAGAFVFSAVLDTLGRLRGWLLLALASVGGNLAAAALHWSVPYHSIGASTAIFAGLGLLTGRAMVSAGRPPVAAAPRSRLIPLGAGMTVLALYGTGGQHVDLVAHVSGFAAGILVGAVAGQAAPPQLPS